MTRTEWDGIEEHGNPKTTLTIIDVANWRRRVTLQLEVSTSLRSFSHVSLEDFKVAFKLSYSLKKIKIK